MLRKRDPKLAMNKTSLQHIYLRLSWTAMDTNHPARCPNIARSAVILGKLSYGNFQPRVKARRWLRLPKHSVSHNVGQIHSFRFFKIEVFRARPCHASPWRRKSSHHIIHAQTPSSLCNQRECTTTIQRSLIGQLRSLLLLSLQLFRPFFVYRDALVLRLLFAARVALHVRHVLTTRQLT